jgi:hypothetical protein
LRLRRSGALYFAVFALLFSPAVVGACGGGGDNEPDELVGLIVEVQGRGNDVRSFTLRTTERTYDIRIAPDVDYGYPLGHLRVHESSLFPVRCTVERREGRLYALEIVDV